MQEVRAAPMGRADNVSLTPSLQLPTSHQYRLHKPVADTQLREASLGVSDEAVHGQS